MLYIFHATSCLPPFNIAVTWRESWLICSPEIGILSPWVSLHQPFSSEAASYWSIRLWLSKWVHFKTPEIVHVQQFIPVNIILLGVSATSRFLSRQQRCRQQPMTLRVTAFVCYDASYINFFLFFHSFCSHFLSIISFPPVWVWRMCVEVCVFLHSLCICIHTPLRHCSVWAYTPCYPFILFHLFSFCLYALLNFMFLHFFVPFISGINESVTGWEK